MKAGYISLKKKFLTGTMTLAIQNGLWSVVGAGLVILIIVVPIIYAVGIVRSLPPSTPFNMSAVEVRDYRGERLSSIADLRQNAIQGSQHINEDTYTLEIAGLVDTPKNYTYKEVLSSFPHYQKVVNLHCVEGWEVSILWEGVRLEDLLEASQIVSGADTVIFYADDGYSSSLSMAYIRDRDILLAYRMNNLTLPAERGFPFQVVAEDKWGYKWVRWVTKIEVSSNPEYHGFWEQRGYAINGSLDRSYFGWWPL